MEDEFDFIMGYEIDVVYGIVELGTLDMLDNKNQVLNHLLENEMDLDKNTKLYHLLTNSKKFNLGKKIFYDYNSLIDLIL